MTLYDDPEYWERKRKFNSKSDNQIPAQTDLSHPQPDPTWDYAHIWQNLCDLAELSQELKAFAGDIEKATSETDHKLRGRLLLLQGLTIQALKALEPTEEGR